MLTGFPCIAMEPQNNQDIQNLITLRGKGCTSLLATFINTSLIVFFFFFFFFLFSLPSSSPFSIFLLSFFWENVSICSPCCPQTFDVHPCLSHWKCWDFKSVPPHRATDFYLQICLYQTFT